MAAWLQQLLYISVCSETRALCEGETLQLFVAEVEQCEVLVESLTVLHQHLQCWFHRWKKKIRNSYLIFLLLIKPGSFYVNSMTFNQSVVSLIYQFGAELWNQQCSESRKESNWLSSKWLKHVSWTDLYFVRRSWKWKAFHLFYSLRLKMSSRGCNVTIMLQL